MTDTRDRRASTQPDAATIAATGAAPPPPGTVVWSMLPLDELLRSGWRPELWGALDGSAAGNPDLRGACIVGRGEPASTPALARSPDAAEGQGVIPLNAYFIR